MEHWNAVKHLLRYVKGTLDLYLTFRHTPTSPTLIGYADADWGGDPETRRSTTGYVFKSFGGPIAWKSKRQTTVALSTTEAEYMATTDAAKEATWLLRLIHDLGIEYDQALPLYNDNNGCVALANNPVHHERSKHIGMRHHFIREKVEDKTIDLRHISTEKNVADLLTKGLARDRFKKLCESMGMTRTSERVGVSE
jgi:hypothetical protein